MKFLKLKLTNFVGIYNGLELDEIEIDLSRVRNKILMIHGTNGSGKSTIQNALSPLPDKNSQIIHGKDGEKEISLIANGTIYNMRIVYPFDIRNDKRGTNKGYISKIVDDKVVQLNPNGNISNYIETVYAEFQLDSNFESLSALGSAKRGIADMKPSERKRFVNNILKELNAYNNIHKTITKRASMFKAMINNIESKLERLGDPDELKRTLQSINHRIDSMNSERDNLNKTIANITAEINLLDPDMQIQNRSNELYTTINELDSYIKRLEKEVGKYSIEEGIVLSDIIPKLEREIMSEEIKIANLEDVIEKTFKEREEDSRSIQVKLRRLESLKDEDKYKEIINNISELEKSIEQWNSILIEIGYDINQEINLTKDEYLLAINALKEIKEIISTFRSAMSYDIIKEVIEEFILKGKNPIDNLKVLQENYPSLLGMIAGLNNTITEINAELKVMKSLELKPEECDMHHCQFISEAIKISETNPEERLASAEQEHKKYIEMRSNADKKIKKYEELVECYNYINRIIRLVTNNNNILRKLPSSDLFSDKKIILDRILHNDPFDEIVYLGKYVEYCDVFDLYNISKAKLYRLQSDLKAYESKEILTRELTEELDILYNKVNHIDSEIEQIRNTILSKRDLYNQNKEDLIIYNDISKLKNEINDNIGKRNELLSSFNSIQNAMETIIKLKDDLERNQSRLRSLETDIKPVSEDRDTINYNLRQLKEYAIEYNEFKKKFAKINQMKEDSSPTTGIQLLFIELYMSNTINLANKLLALLFEGEYHIKPFVINEKEFRIPCKGSGLENNDISSMSNGEIAMISMILSFVMLKQSSTIYNIPKLDEIDGPLDTINRVKFLDILDKIIDLLEVEMCVMISHNNEINYSTCDFIVLKTTETDYNNIVSSGGNIIYQYAG